MNETFEIRQVERQENGATVEVWFEYRTKGISLIPLSLGAWSEWKRVGTSRVDQNGNAL
jgi:hypothetical protein